jgi:hypothetical protein
MSRAIPPLPQCAFMAWCSLKKHRDNFTLLPLFCFGEQNYRGWIRVVVSVIQCNIFNLQGRGKGVPVLLLTEHHAMKAYWGSGGIVPLILLPRSCWR